MHILIVDDEPLAETALRNILAGGRAVERFDTANDAAEAVEEPYGCLPPFALTVTAEQQDAPAALKTAFSNARIEEALDRVFRRSAVERAVRWVETHPQPQKLSQRKSQKIAIKANGRILFIAPEDVMAVHAEGNYVLLQADTGSYLLRASISSITKQLRPYGFLRIHRSVLVNASFVEELQPLSTGEYRLRIKGGREYAVTRTYKGNLKELAVCWIGFDGFVE